MDCKLKSCHLSDHCRLQDGAENCAIHKRYLKVQKGETTHYGLYITDEESIRKYVKRVGKMFPELVKQAESNARNVFKDI